MDLPSAKDLKKLAKACRAAGITSFKGNGIEFTLSDYIPTTKNTPSTTKTPPKDLGENAIETDELVGDALLFWSVGDEPTEGQQQ